MIVCLLGFNVDFKHIAMVQWYFDQCAVTEECHPADTGHDIPPRHSIQTQV